MLGHRLHLGQYPQDGCAGDAHNNDQNLVTVLELRWLADRTRIRLLQSVRFQRTFGVTPVRTHEKPEKISAETVMKLSEVTGLAVMEAKRFLEEASPLFYSRFLEAVYSSRQAGLLQDPIRRDRTLRSAFAAAEQEAGEEVRKEEEEFYRTAPETIHFMWRRSYPLSFDRILKRILKENYDIEWFTIAEMNPGCCF